MLPRIASSQLSAVEEFADLPEAPIDTNKSVEQQSFLPAIVSNKVWNSVSARNHIEMILPLISSEIKESKSVVAQEILTRISINNQLLYFELTAIRIQSVVRRYLSTIRVQQIRRRIALFKNITEHIAARYVEEIVLATSFEISLEFYRQHMRFKRLQESVESELIFVASDILNELLEQLTLEVTNETITDVINVVLALR